MEQPANADRAGIGCRGDGSTGEDGGRRARCVIGGLGMPRSLGAVRVSLEKFARIAEEAMATPWVPPQSAAIQQPGASSRDPRIGGRERSP